MFSNPLNNFPIRIISLTSTSYSRLITMQFLCDTESGNTSLRNKLTVLKSKIYLLFPTLNSCFEGILWTTLTALKLTRSVAYCFMFADSEQRPTHYEVRQFKHLNWETKSLFKHGDIPVLFRVLYYITCKWLYDGTTLRWKNYIALLKANVLESWS